MGIKAHFHDAALVLKSSIKCTTIGRHNIAAYAFFISHFHNECYYRTEEDRHKQFIQAYKALCRKAKLKIIYGDIELFAESLNKAWIEKHDEAHEADGCINRGYSIYLCSKAIAQGI